MALKTRNIPELQPIQFPIAFPVFKHARKLKPECRFFSSLKTSGVSRFGGLCRLYKLPNLLEATRAHLDDHYGEYKPIGITDVEVLKLQTKVWSCLQIFTPLIQGNVQFEVLKAVCTGVHKAGNRKTARNDHILFRDADVDKSDSTRFLNSIRKKKGTKTKLDQSPTDFGEYSVGQLRTLFTLKIPKLEHWQVYRNSNGVLPESFYDNLRLAFVEVLVPQRCRAFGEMVLRPEVAFCKLPVGEEGSLHWSLRARGGKIIDVSTVERTAHCIPVHTNSNAPHEEKSWIFNNRIDVGTWDLIYGSVF
ncbi:MAG: hypothetical protein ACE3JU_11605 [Paenibacillus sp.]|uniref:hypothetical protein n=1 Tax=Paenibacillus sp. TaxID=58172 RepID=UPI003B789632